MARISTVAARIHWRAYGRHGQAYGRNGLACGVAIAALLSAGGAMAQAAGGTEVRPALSIEDQAASATGPIDGFVPSRSLTGSKTDAAITGIPQSVSVIGRRQLDDLPGNKVDEVQGYTAGVRAGQFGTDSDTDWVMIRGFDAGQTGIFMNGLGLYQYGFGGYLIDTFTLERIEVLKGASSAL